MIEIYIFIFRIKMYSSSEEEDVLSIGDEDDSNKRMTTRLRAIAGMHVKKLRRQVKAFKKQIKAIMQLNLQ